MEITANIHDAERLGTGFFVSNDVVATSLHVVAGAETATIKLQDGTAKPVYYATAVDRANDLVLLKTSAVPNRHNAVTLSSQPAVIGEVAIVIGNSEGLQQTISNGLVSGVRDIGGKKLLQISAPISHGNSGGPVFSEQGEVLGIAVGSLEEGQNLNFAVPVAFLKPLLRLSDHIDLATLSSTEQSAGIAGTGSDDYYRKVAEEAARTVSVEARQSAEETATALVKQLESCPALARTQKFKSGWSKEQWGPPQDVRYQLKQADGFRFALVMEFTIPRTATRSYKTEREAELSKDLSPTYLFGEDIFSFRHSHGFIVEGKTATLTQTLVQIHGELQPEQADGAGRDACWEELGSQWRHGTQ